MNKFQEISKKCEDDKEHLTPDDRKELKSKKVIIEAYEGEKKSPVKMIKSFCFDCCGGSQKEVYLCPSTDCSLWAYRFGKSPFLKDRVYSDEEREKMREKFARIRR